MGEGSIALSHPAGWSRFQSNPREGSWEEHCLHACMLACLPALTTTSGSQRETALIPSQAEQCLEILRPLWAGLALGFLPTAACLHCGWVGLSGQEDVRAGSPCPLCDPLGQLDTKLEGWPLPLWA